MNSKTLHRYYDKLTKRERAVLTLNAFGREDKIEYMRLLDTAPYVTTRVVSCGREIFRLIAAVEWHTHKQTQNAALLFMTVGFVDADQHPDVDVTANILAYNIIIRAEGWRVFCGELGLDPVGALRIADADAMILDVVEKYARAINPDVDAVRAKLRETFPQQHVEPKTVEESAAEYRALLNI